MVQRTQRPQRRRSDRRYFARRKVCAFCVDKVTEIDYKDVTRLRRYLSEWAKIEPRRKTGTCAPHQRALTQALKRARYVALLPFAGSHSLMELGRPEGFRGDRGRPDRRERPPVRTEQVDAEAVPAAVAVESQAVEGEALAAAAPAAVAEEPETVEAEATAAVAPDDDQPEAQVVAEEPETVEAEATAAVALDDDQPDAQAVAEAAAAPSDSEGERPQDAPSGDGATPQEEEEQTEGPSPTS